MLGQVFLSLPACLVDRAVIIHVHDELRIAGSKRSGVSEQETQGGLSRQVVSE